ncbi:MAG: IS21 family transposase [Rickettsiales bacterium]
MRKIRELLRLHFAAGFSQHQIAASLSLSVGVVNKYVRLAKCAALSWPLSSNLDDDMALKRALVPLKKQTATSPPIDFPALHLSLKQKGLTLQLLWEEYRPTVVKPYSYVHYCLLYRTWCRTQQYSMRQTHQAGEKVFVDYAGPTIDIIDPDTGEIRTAQLFVGVLGASNYTYIEATWDQKLSNWVGSHVRMFEFFGGVPLLVVPDNLKAAVTRACRYEPDINPTYADCIAYYGTAVMPARPYRPKDKAKAENAVLVAERWILAKMRDQTFFGLHEVNAAIQPLLLELNLRPFKKLPGCRRSQFEQFDKPALKPLPARPYQLAEFKKARVHMDYHIEFDGHYYSVPCLLVKQEIEIRFTTTTIECFHRGNRIAAHARSDHKGAHTTLIEHMPKAHQKYVGWTPERFLRWANDIGPFARELVNYLLTNRPHPEQGFRSCIGLLGLSKRYGNTRLEQACKHALALGSPRRKSVASLLEKGLESVPLPEKNLTLSLPAHDNIRGPSYYAE